MKHLAVAAALCASALHSQSDPTRTASKNEETVHLDNYIVTATPSARAQSDLAQATTVLSGDALDRHRQGTLGETLASQPGVSSTSHGPGASRPVIRGIGGERVRIVENGAGSFDAAALSPDHATSVEPLFAERIEIVRGPAALKFGSAASGGVVNVIDSRIPEERATGGIGGAAQLRYSSAADEFSGAARAGGGSGGFVWHAGGFARDAGNLRTPSGSGGTIANSFVNTGGGFAGATGFWENGRAGAALSLYSTRYGVPGDEPVSIDLDQQRIDLKSVASLSGRPFDEVSLDVSFSNYEHTEFDGDEVGTVFEQDSAEARVELPFSHGSGGSGVIGAHFNRVKLAVEGEEAFIPPSTTDNLAAYVHESLTTGGLLVEAGARVERVAIRPRGDRLSRRSETTVSASAGAVWTWSESWSAAASYMRTTRPPNATELFSDGPHVATRSFEIGSTDLRPERGDAVEITIRKRLGVLSGSATAFSNSIDRFIFRSPTGETEDGLPVFAYEQAGARFHGFEIEGHVHLHGPEDRGLDLKLGADSVHAIRRSTRENLPNIPPRRLSAGLRYTGDAWTAGIDAIRASAQRRAAPHETDTDGYTMLTADVGWRAIFAGLDWQFAVRGGNLLDRVARNHVSLLKDRIAMPGREIGLTVRVDF